MSKLTRNIMDLLESESEQNKKSLLTESKVGNYLVDTIQDYVSNGCDEETAIKYTADFLGADVEDARKAWEDYQGLNDEPSEDEEIEENAGIDMVSDIAASNINLGKTVMGMNEEDLKESIGDTEAAAQDLEDSISGVAMPEVLVPGDDGALADINFIYDTTEVDIESGEQRPGELDLEKLTTEVQQVLSQYITNIETVKLSVARKKNGMFDITGSVIGKELEEASADLNIGAKVDLPDDVVGAAAGALLASEEGEKKKLDEIGPLAAGLAGAAVGAVASNLMSKNETNEAEEEEVETDTEVIDEPAEEPVEEPVEGETEECEACEDEEKIVSILADEDNKELSPEDLAKLILDSIKPEEEHEECPEDEGEAECADGECDTESDDKVNIEMIDEAEEIKEYLEEDEVPAGQADFAHTAFEEVSAKVEQISELKKNDPENELYTSLLANYDKILAELKEYIGDQPVQAPQEPVAPVEAPEGEVTDEVVDTTEEISTEEV